MNKSIIIISYALILSSCSDRSNCHPSIVDEDRVEELYDQNKADSVSEEILQKAKEEVEPEKKSSTSSASRSSGSYSASSSSKDDEDELEYDNMRGFDPASEDDMPDNGMSRFMENNDEEGWD